jgi:hypothetical protein
MGREVRRVPAGWQHPRQKCTHSPWAGGCSEAKGSDGTCYKPLMDRFRQHLADWNERNAKWQEGLNQEYDYSAKPWIVKWVPKPADAPLAFTDWDGAQPSQDDYTPDWPEGERTHFQMYETVSEGTPVSPVMESPEALALWLAENGDGWGDSATYEQWLRVCRGGRAPSLVIANGVVSNGVAGL